MGKLMKVRQIRPQAAWIPLQIVPGVFITVHMHEQAGASVYLQE